MEKTEQGIVYSLMKKTFPLFYGIRERFSAEGVEDADYKNDISILEKNPQLKTKYWELYTKKTNNKCNETQYNFDELINIFNKRKCCKCNGGKAVDWLSCNEGHEVYFILVLQEMF
jgi:hypothetical protein